MKPDALNHLHDFYQPPPPSWTPQTVGWYVVLALALVAAAYLICRTVARWRSDRYRREALRELRYANLSEIPALLKRTALAAWPREAVASLSGEPWLQFLAAHDGKPVTAGVSRSLLDLEYRGTDLAADDAASLRRLADHWIRTHHVRP